MIDSIKKVRDRVLYILKHSRRSRDNDVFLYIMYLEKFHNLSDRMGRDNAKLMYKIMSEARFPESIRRSRQKIQEEGNFVGTRRSDRMKEEKKVRKNIRYV